MFDKARQELRELLEQEIAQLLGITDAQPPLHASPRTKRTRAVTSPDSAWVPQGKLVNVSGFQIKSGLIYVGRHLTSISKHTGPEPALINLGMPVSRARGGDEFAHYLHYYARSYRDLSPEQRAEYLRWLAGGRTDPETPAMYLYLFLYGLERRLLFETPPTDAGLGERDQILAELQRLMELYSGHSYWVRDARALFESVSLMTSDEPVYEGPVPSANKWDFPVRLKVALGQLVGEGKPIPAKWALAWWKAHPECHVPIQATRCPEEFDRLFLLRYKEQFGRGVTVRRGTRELRTVYRPASPGIASGVEMRWRGIPDVTSYRAPADKLNPVGRTCSGELNAYSRLLGREPQSKGTLCALALLPHALFPGDRAPAIVELREWLHTHLGSKEIVALDARELIARWSPEASEKLTDSESRALCDLLQRVGYGVMPDTRFGGGPLKARTVALFRLSPGAPSISTTAYQTGVLMTDLALAVCAATGEVNEVERRYVGEHLSVALHASEAEQQRFSAHLRWSVLTGAKPGSLKTRVARLDPSVRPAVGRFLVGVATADGPVAPEEVKVLTRLYKLLELPSSDLFSDIHAHSVAASEALPMVRPAGSVQPGFAVPRRREAPRTAPELSLDPSKVEAKLADSSRVSELLGSIFVEEEPSAPAYGADVATTPAAPTAEDQELLAGLDVPHSSLLRALAEKETWERSEFEALAAERGLLPDGALDALNEAALEMCDEPLCDGEDPIEIDPEVLKELLA